MHPLLLILPLATAAAAQGPGAGPQHGVDRLDPAFPGAAPIPGVTQAR